MTTAGGTATVGAEIAVVRAAVSPRDGFLAALAYQPSSRASVSILLCGEDAEPRIETTATLLLSNFAPVALASGGVSDESRMSARDAQVALMRGDAERQIPAMPRDRVFVEDESTNTREQAVNCVRWCEEYTWPVAHLVASWYHLPRAVLTFVKAIEEAGSDLALIPVAAKAARWEAPRGMDQTRYELYGRELAKIDEYLEMGHLATWAEGLAYLEKLEGA